MDAVLLKYIGTGTGGFILGILVVWIVLKNKIADYEKKIAEKDKAIVEKDKVIAETKKTLADIEFQKLDTVTANIDIQDKLANENKNYKDSTNKLSDVIEEMAQHLSEDCSDYRNKAIHQLTECIDSFSCYLDKARHYYKNENERTIEDIIFSEIGGFIEIIDAYTTHLNSEDIISKCTSSKEDFKISDSSLGSVKIFLRDVLSSISESERWRICDLLFEKISNNTFVDHTFLSIE